MDLTPEHRWSCPNCLSVHVSHEAQPHTPFHPCAGLKGLSAPYVPAGTSCKVEAREREDWIGRDLPQLDGDGRPKMAVVTTRDDGEDCTMLAPCATATLPRPVFEELRRRLAVSRRN